MASYTTILIDIENGLFRLMGYDDSQGANYQSVNKPFRSLGFDEDFFKEYGEFLQECTRSYASMMQGSITVVLPDSAIFTDVLTLPVTRGFLTKKNNLAPSLASTYPNLKDLTIHSFTATSNKNTATTCLYGTQSKIIGGIRAAHQAQKLPLNAITFEAGATWNSLMKLSTKFKGGTFLFLDIKETSARFVTVYKGRFVGSLGLPFGFSILSSGRLESENMLFSHEVAELEVLNAKEKAKATALTVIDTSTEEGEKEDETDDLFRNDQNEGENGAQAKTVKVLPKKMPRKLPKYLTREVENTPEAIAYENFRFFMKWALDVLQENSQPGAPGECNTVYVNFPSQFDFLLEKANEEQKDISPVVFHSAELNREKEAVTRNLELFGGFFAKRIINAPNL